MVFDYKSPCMRVIISTIFIQFTTDPFQPQSLRNPSCDKQLLNTAKPFLSDGKPRWLPVLEMISPLVMIAYLFWFGWHSHNTLTNTYQNITTPPFSASFPVTYNAIRLNCFIILKDH